MTTEKGIDVFCMSFVTIMYFLDEDRVAATALASKAYTANYFKRIYLLLVSI